MNLLPGKTYRSLDEAVMDMRRGLELVEFIYAMAARDAIVAPERLGKYGLTSHDVDELHNLVLWLQDESAMRRTLAPYVRSDGSIFVSFTPGLQTAIMGYSNEN